MITTFSLSRTLNTPCSLCPTGDPISLPNKKINISGFEYVDDCQTLSSIVNLFPQESTECNLIQSISSLCGCPKQEDACYLCPDGSTAMYGWREMDFLSDLGIRPTCELLEAGLYSYSNTESFCQLSQKVFGDYCGCGAKLGSQPWILDESQQCHMCKNGDNTTTPNKEIDIEGFPLRTCGKLELAAKALLTENHDGCIWVQALDNYCNCNPIPESEACPICGADKSFQVPFPERILDSSLTDIIAPGLSIKCSVLAEIARGHKNRDFASYDGGKCAAFQGLGTECGCPIPDRKGALSFCSEPLDPKFFNYRPIVHDDYNRITCRFVDLAIPFLQDGDRLIYGNDKFQLDSRFIQLIGYFCGCNDGLLTYWGADSLDKQIAAVWIQRITAILSLIGSMSIVLYIVQKKAKNRRAALRLYHKLVLALSCADVLSSVAWGLGPLPTTYDTNLLYGANVNISFTDEKQISFFGAQGNQATCKLQGFLLHLGFTSILYNAALAYYFKLIVVNGFRESNFPQIYRILLLWIPAIIGIAIALATIPFITFTPVGCTIGSYHDSGGWAKIILLFYLPYGPAFLMAPWSTFALYRHVRIQKRNGDRWRISTVIDRSLPRSNLESETSSNMSFRAKIKQQWIRSMTRNKSRSSSHIERDVLLQSIFYLISFLASYTIFFVAFAVDGYEMNSYPLYLALSILTPIQGFLNFIVFFRVKLARWIAKSWEAVSLRQHCTTCRKWYQTAIRCRQINRDADSKESIANDQGYSLHQKNNQASTKPVEKSFDIMSDIEGLQDDKIIPSPMLESMTCNS